MDCLLGLIKSANGSAENIGFEAVCYANGSLSPHPDCFGSSPQPERFVGLGSDLESLKISANGSLDFTCGF